jgi:hypothetical protein
MASLASARIVQFQSTIRNCEVFMTVLSFETLEHRLVPSTPTVTGVVHNWQFRLDIQTTRPAVNVHFQRTVADQEPIPPGVKLAYETMMGATYPNFVTDLKKDLNLAQNGVDPHKYHTKAFVKQFRAAILGGENTAAPSVLQNVAVKDLLPTQNEIDVDKTLAILKNPKAIALYRSGGVQSGSPVLTANDGAKQYIIDGHHRWSMVYICNPNANIESNILAFPIVPAAPVTPIIGLEATQLTIAGDTGKVPSQNVSGLNLLTITKDDFAKAVDKTWVKLSKADRDADLEAFKVNNLPDLTSALWSNVQEMQSHNQPITGAAAPLRKDMPQTDDDKVLFVTLASGKVNYLSPYFVS